MVRQAGARSRHVAALHRAPQQRPRGCPGAHVFIVTRERVPRAPAGTDQVVPRTFSGASLMSRRVRPGLTRGMDNTSAPGPGAPSEPPPPPGASFFDSIRRSGLFRTQERWIGGVAGGIGYRLGIDPLIVRGVLVVLTFFGGLGV